MEPHKCLACLPIQLSAKALLENYKAAADIAFEGPAKLFDLVITKIFYPLFTLILGYIFGARSAGKGDTTTSS